MESANALKRGGDSDSSSPSSSEYSSDEEARHRRKRKEKKRRREEKRTHKKKRKHESNSGDDDDGDSDDGDHIDGKRKRRRTSDDDEADEKRKRKRREKKKKRKHRSSDDDESESESERRKKKKLLKAAKKILKKAKKSEHRSENPKKVEPITEDDYFLKNNEFATWLKENHGLYFSSMSAQETRRLFVNFVDAWNSGGLADKHYEGITRGQRTSHKWSFEERQVDEEDERLQKRKRDKAEQKKFHKEHELLMDELLPKATGKDRLLEKKAIQREKNRANARELSPEPMRETDMMGGGDDFKMMLARERARREKRASLKAGVLQKKLSVVEEKETAAMDQFRAIVNTAGGKITIPRRD